VSNCHIDMKHWRIYLTVALISLCAEAIGERRFSLGVGVILLFPMLFALLLALITSPLLKKVLGRDDKSITPALTLCAIYLLVARISASIGPKLGLIATLSPALALQEVGHFLGTVALGVPVAVLLGIGREAVGACFSIAREGSLAVIGEKFGLTSPEGRGVLFQYIFGSVFGALYYGIMAGWVDSLGIFSVMSLSMASGVGSISMMIASSEALGLAHPGMKEQITAAAGMANIITMMLGLYVSVFISLPLADRFHMALSRLKGGNRGASERDVS